jgi:hypothetical protein
MTGLLLLPIYLVAGLMIYGAFQYATDFASAISAIMGGLLLFWFAWLCTPGQKTQPRPYVPRPVTATKIETGIIEVFGDSYELRRNLFWSASVRSETKINDYRWVIELNPVSYPSTDHIVEAMNLYGDEQERKRTARFVSND